MGVELYYTGPSGRRWQLQGPDQNAHPVTLLRKPVGLFGPPVDVQRRRVLASRNTFRVSTLPDRANIELTVQIAPPDGEEYMMENDGGMAFAYLLSEWLDDWPVDDGTTTTPPTGTLMARIPGAATRFLDVYRTEEVESLLPVDPLVAGRARFLMVCSADDPYPRLPDGRTFRTVASGATTTLRLTNFGTIAVAPRITLSSGPATVEVQVSAGGSRLANFTFKTPGPGTFDLDPNAMTFSLAGDAKPMEWWWSPNSSSLSKAAQTALSKYGTPAAAVTPIAAPWGQNADALIPAHEEAVITVKSSVATEVKAELTPRVERLLF